MSQQKPITLDLINSEIACLESEIITAYLLKDCNPAVIEKYLRVVRGMYQQGEE